MFVLLICLFGSLNGFATEKAISQAESPKNWQEELQEIDKEAEQLEDLKNRYKASAARHEDQAMRWQFEQNLKQEARRASKQADLDRQMIEQIQARLDHLQARKAEILKKHPGAS
ncbi:MAG: hypothetical protein HYZ48_05905 [Chlamydiales bacterium]|nr:hypothetical protein [Chlamydiales bacterium]